MTVRRSVRCERALVLAVLLGSPACRDGRDGEDGDDAAPCSVEQEADGAALIRCPDGSSARVEGGADGSDGYATLVVMAEEPPGASCESGGVRVESGIDKNQDDTLDESEINATFYVCHGQDGVRPDVLTSLAPIPAGDECAGGGVRVLAGSDDDGDGALGDDEVQLDYLLCHDEQHAALTRLSVTAPGEGCERGGLLLESGLDLDGDGSLDDEEVTASEAVCHDGFGPFQCVEPSAFDGFYLGYVDGTPFEQPALATVDPSTGAVTQLALLAGGLSLGGLAYDHAGGVLFATTREDPARLGTVALDGSFTPIGAIGSFEITALAVEPLSGALLAVRESSEGQHDLVSLSRADGTPTLVDALGSAPYGDGWDAMAVGPDCRVYATAGTFLYAVDSLGAGVEQVADLGIVLDALLYDGVLSRWFGYWIYEGGQFVTFEHGAFEPSSVTEYEGFEVRAMTRHPSL